MDLSIIITVHNLEKYVGFCLDSVLNQTLSHDRYEIVAVDDYSTDGSLIILREYEKKYPNIRVIHSEKNNGLGATWNIGLRESHGKWIHFVDADDFVAPNVYEDLIQYAEKSKADMISVGYWRTSYHDFKHGSVFVPKDDTLVGDIDSIEKRRKLTDINSTLWAKLFSRKLLESVSDENGKFFREILASDGSKHLDIVYHCKRYDIYSKPIYYYWQHTYRISENTLIKTINEFHYAMVIAKDGGFFDELEDIIIASYIKSYVGFIRKMFGFISYEKAYKLNLQMYKKMISLIPDIKDLCESRIRDGIILGIISSIENNSVREFKKAYLKKVIS